MFFLPLLLHSFLHLLVCWGSFYKTVSLNLSSFFSWLLLFDSKVSNYGGYVRRVHDIQTLLCQCTWKRCRGNFSGRGNCQEMFLTRGVSWWVFGCSRGCLVNPRQQCTLYILMVEGDSGWIKITQHNSQLLNMVQDHHDLQFLKMIFKKKWHWDEIFLPKLNINVVILHVSISVLDIQLKNMQILLCCSSHKPMNGPNTLIGDKSLMRVAETPYEVVALT